MKRGKKKRQCISAILVIIVSLASVAIVQEIIIPPLVLDEQVAGKPGQFLTLIPCGGLSNNRISILGAVAVAKATNSGIILPRIPVRTQMCVSGVPCTSYQNSTEWWKNVVDFEHLFDIDSLTDELAKLSISALRQVPPCARRRSARERAQVSISWKLENFSYYSSHPQLNAPLKLTPETSPNNLFGWQSECNFGIIDLGCTLFNFKPTIDDFAFWDSALSAQKFSRPVLEAASELTALLGDEYISIHLRIESDMPHGMRPDDGEHPIDGVVKALDFEGIEENATVFLSSGVSSRSKAVLQFTDAEEVKKFGFNFFTVHSLGYQLPDLEFAAAVSYVVCMGSYLHFGPMSSSFDVLLDVERRRIRTGNTKFRPHVVALNKPLGVFEESFPEEFLQYVGQHSGHEGLPPDS